MRKPPYSFLIPLLSLVVGLNGNGFAGEVKPAGSTQTPSSPAPLILPLKEIRPGMKGTCHTVFSGTRIEHFDFEVMGISRDFAGPQRDVVWCRMLTDPTGQMVVAAGMSGSPCYIEGKMIGALAYGWAFNKNPVFGVQPIESMMELFDFEGNQKLTVERPGGRETASRIQQTTPALSADPKSIFKNLVGFMKPMFPLSRAHGAGVGGGSGSAEPLALPLEISGLHPRIRDVVLENFREAGFTAVSAGGGGHSPTASSGDLVPGAALAGIICQGDLNMTVTGTLSYRDGDRILAFGHPFLGVGAIDVPFGKAEILGVISSYRMSMKLSNKGEIAGTLTQDRMSAVAGKIGTIPKLTPMKVKVRRPGTEKNYQLEFFDNKYFTPLVYQTALLQFLSLSLEAADECTLKLVSEIELEGLPPLKFEDRFAGEDFSWVIDSVIFPALQIIPLYRNEFGIPRVKQISITADIEHVNESAQLVELSVNPREGRVGESVSVRAGFQTWRGRKFYQEYDVKIPEEAKSAGRLEVILADAHEANRLLGNALGYFQSSLQPQNLPQLVTALNTRHANDCLYLFLRRKAGGMYVQNQRLSGLPASVRKLLAADQGLSNAESISTSILQKTTIPFGTVVQGAQSAILTIP
jgi:hypothetical protein